MFCDLWLLLFSICNDSAISSCSRVMMPLSTSSSPSLVSDFTICCLRASFNCPSVMKPALTKNSPRNPSTSGFSSVLRGKRLGCYLLFRSRHLLIQHDYTFLG